MRVDTRIPSVYDVEKVNVCIPKQTDLSAQTIRTGKTVRGRHCTVSQGSRSCGTEERKKNMVSLSDGEWKIMNRLWEKESTITELKNGLCEETGWDKHIIITMLSRMEKKGAAAHRDGGRAKIFYPLVTREEVSRQETRGFLQKVYRGSLGMMVNAMVEDQALSEEELQELYGILERARKKKAESGK